MTASFLWGTVLVPLQFPGRYDNFLLQFRQARVLIAAALLALALLLILALAGLIRAKNLIERSDLGKIHVAERAPHFAIGAVVIRPREIGNDLVHIHAELLHGDHVCKLAFFVGA